MLTTKNYQDFQVLSETGTVIKTFSGSSNRCLPGDTVTPTQDGVELLKRNQPNPLVGTVHIQSKYLFGHTSRNVPIYLFFPYDTSYPPMRVGCSAKDSKNKIGLVLFESWEKGEQYPRGILQQVLGDAGDPDVEELALKYNYAPNWKKIAKIPEAAIHTNRFYRSFFNGFTFNIDPPGCKDIDDCFTIQREGDLIHFSITIADLYEIVFPGTDLDLYAKKQGSTLYSPEGEAIAPMLPRWISEEKASLLPNEERRGITLSMVWDGTELKGFRFYPSTITNEKSYTYDSIYENKEVCKVLTEISSYLQGSLCEDSHKWVEHAMILYNKKVAELFLREGSGLLRKLATTSTKRLEQKAAEYCLPSEDAVHAAMEHSHYTHATSPIRRYADLLAQRYLVPLIWLPDEKIKQPSQLDLLSLNACMKRAANFQRDLCFLRAVSESSSGVVEGIVLDWKESHKGWKLWIEVPTWKQIITFHMKGQEHGEEVVLVSPDEQDQYHVKRDKLIQVKYYCDRAQPNWKKRMVFGVSK
jgi:exoribonuclease R